MIIIGYQGIEKSTLANKTNNFIYLESSHFFVNGERDENWYKIYCRIAVNLSYQGFNVFTSSHKVVREEFKGYNERILLVYPALELKDEWIGNLHNRFDNTQLVKDYKALKRAEEMYEVDITDLKAETEFEKIEIKETPYDLEELIRKGGIK